MSGELAGRVAVVTGAAHERGIGSAIGRELANRGAAVALVDVAGVADALEDRVADIGAAGGRALAAVADATRPDEIETAVARVVDELGPPEILVNNAGVGLGSAHLLENTEEVWATTLAVNVMGVNRFCCAIIPYMRERGGGVIVNNSSMAGLGALPAMPAPYTASKHAVIGLTKSIALEFAPERIRCVAICPGSVKTQLYDNVMDLYMEMHGCSREEAEGMETETVPLDYSCEPEEVASVVGFLVSPAAGYVTGIAVPIAGGMSRGL